MKFGVGGARVDEEGKVARHRREGRCCNVCFLRVQIRKQQIQMQVDNGDAHSKPKFFRELRRHFENGPHEKRFFWRCNEELAGTARMRVSMWIAWFTAQCWGIKFATETLHQTLCACKRRFSIAAIHAEHQASVLIWQRTGTGRVHG